MNKTPNYTSALKARNVDDEIAAHGFEKGIRRCVIMLAEYQAVLRESQVELAQTLDRTIDLVAQFSAVAENMKSAVDSLKKKDVDVGGDDDTHH